MKKIYHLLSAVLLSGVAFSVLAAQDEPKQAIPIPQISEGWRYSLTPYLWLLNVSGQVSYGDHSIADEKFPASQLLSKLQYAAMIEGEVHKGNWGFAANLLYSSLQNQGSRIVGQNDLGSTTNMNMGIYNLAATYTLYSTPQVYLDAMAGVRILTTMVKTDVNVQGVPAATSLSATSALTNPIVGVKGRVRISDSDYFIPFYVDVGGGVSGTQVTTQGIIGIGKAYDWGDISLNFNNLFYRTQNNNVTSNLDLYGAALGVTFKF